MNSYRYRIITDDSLEHGIRDLFKVNRRKKEKGSSYREKSKTGDETGVWTNAHGKQREPAGPDWKKKDNNDENRESGKKGNRSKYEGGFITKNGRSNNSQAYNHDYYMRNKDKWNKDVPSHPTERDVRYARMDASNSIAISKIFINGLLKGVDPDKARSLGWDKTVKEQVAYTVEKQLKSLATTNKYKKQNPTTTEKLKKNVEQLINKGNNAVRKAFFTRGGLRWSSSSSILEDIVNIDCIDSCIDHRVCACSLPFVVGRRIYNIQHGVGYYGVIFVEKRKSFYIRGDDCHIG